MDTIGLEDRSQDERELDTARPADSTRAILRRRYFARTDLQFTPIANSRAEDELASSWNVLDPLTRQSYRIGQIEYWLLTRARDNLTLQQLFHRLHEEHPEIQFSDGELLQLVSNFHQKGLLRTEGGHRAIDSDRAGWVQRIVGKLVVIQIRGLRPDRWLKSIAPYFDPVFSNAAVAVWITLSVLTASCVGLEFQRLAIQFVSWDWLTNPMNGGMLLAVFIGTRAVHELGHAIVCTRFGVRCPDIGVFLILGAPCVYCDVSESWQLPRRLHRAAVAAAGMYVELIVATIAAWIWLATIEGPANTLALQVMFVCSISTIAINANPLMRFDGYYILADLLDEVNLRSKADRILGNYVRRLVLGPQTLELQTQNPQKQLRTQGFAVFSLAGWIYRATLSIAISTALIAIYSNWNLLWIGRILATVVLVSWWGVPFMNLLKNLITEAHRQRRRLRPAVFASVTLAIVALLPIPSRRFASGWLQPVSVQGVFAGTTARLRNCRVQDGQRVEQGDALFRLQSVDLVNRVVARQAAAQRTEIRYSSARRQRDMYEEDVDLSSIQTELNAMNKLATSASEELQSLLITAPVGGKMIAQVASAPAGPLSVPSVGNATWCERAQIGRVVPEGTLLATICAKEFLAVVPLSEQQLSCVVAGTEVRLRLASAEAQVVQGTVSAIVQLDEVSSISHNNLSEQINRESQHGYAAIIHLPTEHSLSVLTGASVEAVFVAKAETLWEIASSWAIANLRFLAN